MTDVEYIIQYSIGGDWLKHTSYTDETKARDAFGAKKAEQSKYRLIKLVKQTTVLEEWQ